jgi:hypothetical protein
MGSRISELRDFIKNQGPSYSRLVTGLANPDCNYQPENPNPLEHIELPIISTNPGDFSI